MRNLILCFVLLICFAGTIAKIRKQHFCQKDRCLTCMGRYCTTTCKGPGCSECQMGTCCDGVKCNICRGDKCCEDYSCNQCVNNCLKGCSQEAQCHFNCFETCIGPTNIITDAPFSGFDYVPVNVTTTVNITNIFNTTNHIEKKIVIDGVRVNETSTNEFREPLADQPIVDRAGCCNVVHPETCQDLPSNSSGYNQLCQTGRHHECSELCISKEVHIVETNHGDYRCLIINSAPYFFCGRYSLENCDVCYHCSGKDITYCANQPECSQDCQSSLLLQDLYNRIYVKQKGA